MIGNSFPDPTVLPSRIVEDPLLIAAWMLDQFYSHTVVAGHTHFLRLLEDHARQLRLI